MTAPVVVTGGTGTIGGALLAALGKQGVPVRALVRSPGRLAGRSGVEEIAWDGSSPPPGVLAGARAVVHLAGEPLFGGLPTGARLERVRASRVASTQAFARAFGSVPEEARPRTFLCASAVGYYGDRGEEPLPETAPPGEGFLADLCVAWEAAAARAAGHGVRVVSLRIGVVLSRGGGALPMLARPFRLGLGGRLGDGRQWFPWIHLDDVVGLLAAALEDARFAGAVNAAAPEAVRNATFTGALARVLGRPALLPVPAFAVRALAGALSGELLGSKRVVPERAAELGFRFRHPEIEGALRAELG